MKIDRSGVPFIAAALAPALVLIVLRMSLWAVPFVVIAAFFLFFFRDPERHVPDGSRLVVAPADGRVLLAGPGEPSVAPPGDWLQVSVFLSPLDVHINRMPVAGRVERVEYRPGRFLPAYRPEASQNERTEIHIESAAGPVVVRQVVGVLARRVVCRLAEGQAVAIGQRFGLMKFGSRMDVFLPPTAALRVHPGDRVRGGETVIAVLNA